MFELESIKNTKKDQVIDYLLEVSQETPFLLFSQATPFEKVYERLRHEEICFLAKLGQEIVGLIIVSRKKSATISHNYELSMSVLKKYWGHGVGSLLIKQACALLQARAIANITLLTHESNTRAIAFYTKNGFKQTGIYPKYFQTLKGDLTDAVLMSKTIENKSGMGQK